MPNSLIKSVKLSSQDALCPFHDGAETLDLLLGELDPTDTELFNAALDLRSLATAGNDAAACLEQLSWVRRLLGGRHYLAFYRVRCWAHRALSVDIRPHCQAPWQSQAVPVNSARIDEMLNTALATLAVDGDIPASAQARFVFMPRM